MERTRRNRAETKTTASGTITLLALIAAALATGCGLTSAGLSAQQTSTQPVSVSLTPPSAAVLLGDSVALTAAVSNASNVAVTWSVSGIPGGNSAVGTISGGVFTAPQVLPIPPAVTVTATSAADPSKSASATITITSDVAVAITPPSAGVELGAEQAFGATITSAGKPSAAASWSLTGAGCAGSSCGGVSTAGVFTAPAILPSPPTVLLTATSAADPSKSASIAITIISRFALALSGPTSVSVSSANVFSAVLMPIPGSNPSPTISWSVSGANCSDAACGTISASGPRAAATYTAPAATIGVVNITATPLADPSKAQSMPVTVTTAPGLTLSPPAATIDLGASANFTASVTGASGSNVTWDVNGVIGGNSTLGTITPSPGNGDIARRPVRHL